MFTFHPAGNSPEMKKDIHPSFKGTTQKLFFYLHHIAQNLVILPTDCQIGGMISFLFLATMDQAKYQRFITNEKW